MWVSGQVCVRAARRAHLAEAASRSARRRRPAWTCSRRACAQGWRCRVRRPAAAPSAPASAGPAAAACRRSVGARRRSRRGVGESDEQLDNHVQALLRLARRSAASGVALAQGVEDLAVQSREEAARCRRPPGRACLGVDRRAAGPVLSARVRVPGHRARRRRAGRRRPALGSGMTACGPSSEPRGRKNNDERT